MIRTNKKKTKGPQISVPASAKPDAPLPGRSSFAARVKKTRRRSTQSQASAQPQRATTSRPKTAGTEDSAHSQPKIMSREERLAAAKDIEATELAAQPPGPSITAASSHGETAVPASQAATKTAPTTTRGPKRPSPKPPPKPQRDPDPGFVAVGRIQTPHGLHGEVKVTSLTENPERFRPRAKLFAGQQPVTISGVREASGFVYLSLKGFNDRTSVEKFRNTLLQVPESELPELEEGEYYRFQLVGLSVLDRDGIALGEIAEVIETGATDVFRITTSKKPDLLLAAAPDVILEIDIRAKRMVVDPPDWR